MVRLLLDHLKDPIALRVPLPHRVRVVHKLKVEQRILNLSCKNWQTRGGSSLVTHWLSVPGCRDPFSLSERSRCWLNFIHV